MAKKTMRAPVRKQPAEQVKPMVIAQMTLQAADRRAQDQGDFRSGLQAAESVSNPNRSRLYDLYTNVLLDGHLSGIIEKRIGAVRNKQLVFKRNDEKVDELDAVINTNAFREVVSRIMEVRMWGLSGMEFIPGPRLCLEEIPRKHIKIERGQITLNQGNSEGIDYAGLPNVWVIGAKRDLGLLAKCAPYALWKRGNMADWAQYVEIFGQPFRIAKYDAYDATTKNELSKMMDEAGSSLAMMIPKQAEFEVLDGKSSNGNGDLQDKFKKALNDEMSVIVLGNTETTTSSDSSGYAQAKEQGSQQLQITVDDMAFTLNHLNDEHFLAILASYGHAVEGGAFAWADEADLTALQSRLNIDKEVARLVPMDDDYFYTTYSIPKPANYEAMKAEREAMRAAITDADPDEGDEPAKGKPAAKAKGKALPGLSAPPGERTALRRWMLKAADFFGLGPLK